MLPERLHNLPHLGKNQKKTQKKKKLDFLTHVHRLRIHSNHKQTPSNLVPKCSQLSKESKSVNITIEFAVKNCLKYHWLVLPARLHNLPHLLCIQNTARQKMLERRNLRLQMPPHNVRHC
jgi:hypothetical protein